VRTFEIFESYARKKLVRLKGGILCLRATEKHTQGQFITLENIAKKGAPPVYIDPSKKRMIPYLKEEIDELMRKFILVERFPKPKRLKK
jgi:hypothetical protein